MAINLYDLLGHRERDEQLERERRTRETRSLIGAPMVAPEVTTPYDNRLMVNAPSTEGSGFLGSDRGIAAQMALGAGLQTQAGLSPQEAAQVMSPQTRFDEAQYRAMAAQNQDMVDKKGNYKTFKDYASGIASLSDRQAKALQPWKASVKDYENISALYKSAGKDMSQGQLGAFDIALQRGFMKSLSAMRPENYMNDDALAIAANTMGVGSVEGVINYLKGEGTLDKPSREALLKAFRSIMQTNYESMADEQYRFDRQAEIFFPETAKEDIFGRTSRTYDPSATMGGPTAARPASQTKADALFGRELVDTDYKEWKRKKGYK